MKKFTLKQRKTLLKSVVKAKENNVRLGKVFESFAKKNNKAVGSVRNYYYKTIKNGNSMGLNAKSHKPFTSQEEVLLVRQILTERLKTNGIRSAIKNIADNDRYLMIRYQNKYRNLLKKNKQLIMREVVLQKQNTGKCFNPYIDRAKNKFIQYDKESASKKDNIIESYFKIDKKNTINKKMQGKNA